MIENEKWEGREKNIREWWGESNNEGDEREKGIKEKKAKIGSGIRENNCRGDERKIREWKREKY